LGAAKEPEQFLEAFSEKSVVVHPHPGYFPWLEAYVNGAMMRQQVYRSDD
jgi:hypothetical protein